MGIPIVNDEDISILNFIILITKWYINKKRTEQQRLSFFELLTILQDRIEATLYVNIINENQENEDAWYYKLGEILGVLC